MKQEKALLAALVISIAGCASMAGGANLSDDSLRSDIAGVLGDAPENIKIESRRSEGVNTYVTATTKKGTKVACNFLGGGVLSFGMRTAPSCSQLAQDGSMVPGTTSCNAALKAAGQCK